MEIKNQRIRILDLFARIGGFSLGLERTGYFETAAFCEIEPYCREILKQHWSGVPIYEDITTARFTESVDLVTAGFPCQDISYAGLGAGLTGARSGLYWNILRTLRMVGRKPLLLENVAGLLTRGLGTVSGSLAEIGYDSEWHCIPASAVGAPHPRDRIWLIAYPDTFRPWGSGRQQRSEKEILFKKLPALLRRRDWQWNELPEPRICRSDDGIPNRTHRLKALGNAVVPHIPELLGYTLHSVFRES